MNKSVLTMSRINISIYVRHNVNLRIAKNFFAIIFYTECISMYRKEIITMADTRNNERWLMELLAKAYPQGMSSSELADIIGVSAQTIRDMIDRLRDEHGIEDNEKGGPAKRYFLAPQKYMQHIKLTQAQSWMLYLSIRRIVRAQQHRFQIVKMLIHQLTQALHPSHQMDIPDTETDEKTDDIFKQLVEAWFNHRWIKIYYRPLNQSQAHELRIAPLWFEPAIWSDSNYVICWAEKGNKRVDRTLKLDRIEKVILTSGDTFTPPPIDNLLAQIEDAWGVWLGEDENPQQVVLHFDNRVLDRLYETRWHPTQNVTSIGNGKIQWTGMISEPREMLPWIRSWGADVEVIEPLWLRDMIGAESERMAKLYGRMTGQRKGFF